MIKKKYLWKISENLEYKGRIELSSGQNGGVLNL